MFEIIRYWLTARARRRALPADPAPPVASAPLRPKKRGEFPVFQTYLEGRFADLAVLSFQQIEDLTGVPLPEAARTRPGWWTETEPGAERYAPAWHAAGRQAVPNLPARNVGFARAG